MSYISKHSKTKQTKTKQTKQTKTKQTKTKQTKTKQTKSKQIKTKQTKSKQTKTQKGGDLPNTGTAGTIDTLVADFGAMIMSSINTIVDAVKLAEAVISIPGDLGTAYKESAAPGSNF